MISLLFKHKIAELCINTLFDALKNNFDASKRVLNVGSSYSSITLSNGDILRNSYIADCHVYKVMGENIMAYTIVNRNTKPFQVLEPMVTSSKIR